MFNAETAIAAWRQQMLAVGMTTPVPLAELETHLREEIDRRTQAGQEESDAFQAALQSLGSVDVLRTEFEKIKHLKKSRRWKLIEIYFWIVPIWYPLLVASQAFFFRSGSFGEMTLAQQSSSLAAAVVFSMFAWITQLGFVRIPALRSNLARNAIFLPVLIWLVILAYFIIPRCGLTQGQTAVASLWGLAPFGTLIGWYSGWAASQSMLSVLTGAA
jgi:hypothetical protein